MTTLITKIQGLQVLDSRGRPTVCAIIELSDGSIHKASVPSGASTGTHEASELRDHNSPQAEKFYAGTSVYQAVSHINNEIAPRLVGGQPSTHASDETMVELDATSRHERIGANATLAVSIATAKACAHLAGLSLAQFYQGQGPLLIPMPMVNILSGGAHANGALDIQDVLVLPHGAQNFAQALSWVVAIREMAAKLGAKRGFVTNLVADEGGLGIGFESSNTACAFVSECIESVGLNPGVDVSIALDIASTQFYSGGKYTSRNSGTIYSSQQWNDQLVELVHSHPIISIEDPFAEDDWDSWNSFMNQVPSTLQVVGDDLFTTNLERLRKGIAEKSANAILIKANQNGLITHTHEVIKHAQNNGFKTIVSARSGETEDSWLSDIATGWSAGQIKVGSTHGSDRTAKWNRLLELEATQECVFSQPF
jgi:enolase